MKKINSKGAGLHRVAGSGSRKLLAATAALSMLVTGLAGFGLASTASAAPGDECGVNALIQQDVTLSFSDQNLEDTKDQLSDLAQYFVDGQIPATLGITSFGILAPLSTAPTLLGADVRTQIGADSFSTTVGGYDFDQITPPATGGSTGTNWELGLVKAREAADAQGSRIILFVTDGVPNVWTNESGDNEGNANYNPIAAQEAGAVAAQLRADGYRLIPVFVATERAKLHGLNDPIDPTPAATVEQAMQVLQAGWTIDKAIEISELGETLRRGALDACSPAISLEKTHQTPVDVNGNGLTDAGDTVTFAFDVRNVGDLPLTNVTVTDATLAERGVSLVNAGLIGDLALDGTAQVLSEPYTITDADVIAGSFDNVATVLGNSPKGPVTDEDDDTVPTQYRNGIEIIKSHADTDITDVNGNNITDTGDTVVFTFDVTNTGSTTLANVTVTDEVLAGHDVGLENNGVIGDLAAGASGSVRSLPYTITAGDVNTGQFVNVATATGTPPVGPPPTDDDDDIVPTNPVNGIEIIKSHADTDITDVNGNNITDTGDTVKFTFDVTNTGTTALKDVTVTDPLLAEFGVTLDNEGVIGDLAAGASATLQSSPYTITQADVDAGQFLNIATATGTPPTGPPPTDDDDDIVPTDPTSAIELVKSHAATDITDVNRDGLTDAGDTVVFTFDVTNTGNTTLTDVTVTDATLAARGVGLENDGVLGTLAPGETKSIKSNPATITDSDVDAGGFRNVATATGTPPRGDKPVDEDDDLVPTQRPVTISVAPASGSSGSGSGSGSAKALASTGTGPWLLPVTLSGLLLLLGGAGAAIVSRRRQDRSAADLSS